MPTSKHSELERKFGADHVSPIQFHLWCEKHHPVGHKDTKYPDVYYRRGTSVIRHRKLPKNGGELTVKQRKNATDSTDRLEIDLKFAEGITHEDVAAFVKATGWEEVLELDKHFSEVYWFAHLGAEVAVSLYKVEDKATGETRQMLEVEIEKGAPVTQEEALRLLGIWCGVIAEDLGLAEPLNDSLYEIFTGQRYEMAV